MAWSLGFRNLIIPGSIIVLSGMPYDHSRNQACMTALECGASHLFFLDSDVIPPKEAVLRLLSHRLPIVSGVYYRRSPPAGVPVMMKPVGQWLTRYKPNALVEVDVVGAGCLLIAREVLERLPPQSPQSGKHWFDWRVDQKSLATPERLPLSEDFAFCMACKQIGYKVMVDTGVTCRHVGLAQATYGRLDPADAAVHT